MKKKLLVLAVIVMAVALCLTVAGIASAATVTTQADYYLGDYGDLFADKGDAQQEWLDQYGTQAVVIFGQVADVDSAEYEYGAVIYPASEELSATNAKLFPAKSVNAEGKFGIAVSLSGELLNSGAWKVATYVVPKSAVDKDGVSFSETYIDTSSEISFSTTKLAAPANIAVADDVVTWDQVDGAESYNVSIEWIRDGNVIYDNAVVANTADTSWDLTAYFKSLEESELKKYSGLRPEVRVAAVSGGIYGEYAIIANALGNAADGGNNALYVVTNATELKSVPSGNRYVVITRDIDLGNVSEELTPSGAYSIGARIVGALNGLNHKISYVSGAETAKATGTSGYNFNGVFNTISLNPGQKVQNLTLEAEITSQITFDDFHFNALANSIGGGEVENCYFKVRGYTPNGDYQGRMRLNLMKSGSATFNNCVFDIVSYKADGTTARVPGYNQTRGGMVSLSTISSITNCSFIINQEVVNNNWCYTPENTTLTDSAMYVDIPEFYTAFKDNTLAGKDNYIAAGWNVDEYGIFSFDGNPVYVPPIAAPANLATSAEGLATWDAVSGASSYDVMADFGSGWVKMDTVAGTSYDINNYLKSLSSTELDAIHDTVMNISVVANSDILSSSNVDDAILANALKSGTNGKIKIAKTVADLRAYCTSAANIRNYVILANDIDFGTVTDSDMLISDSKAYGYLIAGTFEGSINGLGHGIIYNYQGDGQRYVWEEGAATTTKYTFSGLFDRIASTSSRLLNLRVEATGIGELTATGTTDLWWTMLARGSQATGYNCYFKMRYTCTNKSTTEKTRTGISWQLSQAAYENCIFDMVTFDKDGNMRAAGSAADCEIGWENPSDKTTLTKCAYITNTETTNRNIGCVPDSYTAMYKDFAAFINAWNADSIDKQSYIDGGWSVDGEAVYLHGVQINA